MTSQFIETKVCKNKIQLIHYSFKLGVIIEVHTIIITMKKSFSHHRLCFSGITIFTFFMSAAC